MTNRLCSVRLTCRLLVALGLVSLAGCSQQAPAQTPAVSAASQPAEQPAAAPAAQPARPTQVPPQPPASKPPEMPPIEPPDGKWLTDEQGRQYFVEVVPKVDGWYHWLNDEQSQVRLWHGMVFDVEGHDEESIQIKIYKVLPDTSPGAVSREATPEEKEKIAATYRNQTGTADRLTFTPFNDGLPNRGQWRNGFKVADMNGDGHPDIVHGPARKTGPQPVIFLGDGKGGWRRWAEMKLPSLPYDYGDVAVGDWNKDGKLDLAFAVHLRGLIALVADGPGSFKEWGQGIDFGLPGQGEGPGFTSRTLEAADWNGDGRLDLISIGEGPSMAAAPTAPGGRRGSGSASYGAVVYLNQGDGTWVRKDEIKDRVLHFGEDLAVADFTNDGQLDIVLGSSVLGEMDIMRIGGAADGGWARAPLPELRPRTYVGAVDAADFDGDGRADLAVGFLSREGGAWRTGVDVLLARGEGKFERRAVAVEETRDWLTALDSGDLDGDGKLDLAAVTGDGEVWIFLGKGDGSFAREESPEIPPYEGGCRGYDVQIVNLDGDRTEELVAEFAGEPSALFAPTLCQQQGGMGAWKPQARK
ncbi:MAG TPA: VCBS repeat-containing protein [Thermoanaerobaculia bacterium]|nr:VCBS repeat-containing protein [Thermoanaerobaculia bacterium]